METMTDQEKDQILADYAESFRLRFIANSSRVDTRFAIEHPESWRRCCRENTREDIESGGDTWERIAKVAAAYRAERDGTKELRQAAESIAGHIRKPMSAREIADALESGEYHAELILQHLLRLVADR